MGLGLVVYVMKCFYSLYMNVYVYWREDFRRSCWWLFGLVPGVVVWVVLWVGGEL